jgi:EAL domain-containing protein (putative c-di-GMP-specific phosphodiesterase class I)
MEGDLLADLDAALAASGADPSMLEFELTESHLMEDVERARRVLDVVRSRGATISVDDFGTGHSSMTYLQQLPLDAVKVDRAFVERAARFDFDSMVIDSVVRLAGALCLDVVAEGVEEPDQLRVVRECGVDRLQGFLLARPVPIDEAEAILFSGPPLDLDALGAG